MQTMTLFRPRMSQEFLMGLVVTLMAAFFLMDLTLPLGVAGGIPYVTVVLVTLWLHGGKVTMGMAIVCSCLTILGYFFSPSGGEPWKVIANRTLAIYAVWVTAILTVQYKNRTMSLVEERSLLRRIIDLIPQWVFLQSSNGQFLLANQATANAFGVTVEELVATDSPVMRKNTETAKSHKIMNDEVLAKQTSREITNEKVKTVNQGIRTFDFLKLPCCVGEKSAVLSIGVDQTEQQAMIEDITYRKQAELSLKQQALVFETISDGVILTDLDGRIVDWNPGAERMFGYEKEEVLGKSPTILHYPEDEPVLTNQIRDGLKKEKVWRGEIDFVRKDGSHGVTETVVVPLHGIDGTVIAAVRANRDVTVRKQAEQRLKEAQEALRRQNEELESEVELRTARIRELEQRRMQVDKLAALAQVAAGLAHEINNPLASISQSMLLVKQAVDPRHPYFEYVERIDECIRRMARIVRQIYELYRPQNGNLLRQDVVPTVRMALDIMQSAAERQQVLLSSRLPQNSVKASYVRSELIQVLCNLIQNALDASGPAQEVRVNISETHEAVAVSISDHGSGMTPETTSNVFEPFFSTKSNSVGESMRMGLGLTVSKSLIEAMGGVLNFTSIEGEGTTFVINLVKS